MSNINDRVEQNINNLLNSNITGYKISQDTGISQSFISRLRSSESKLDNTNWSVIKILNKYAEKELKDDYWKSSFLF